MVIPEGIISEIKLFLQFIESKKLDKKIKFIVRLHPVLKNNKKIINKIEKLPNCKLSFNNLAYDLERTKYVLFRGSNMVVNCINNGLIPLYLNNDNSKVDIDPIYNLKIIKIKSIKDLNHFINNKNIKKRINIKKIFSNYKNNFF